MSTAIPPVPSTSRVARITRVRARRHPLATLAVLAVLALSGCGIRLETPPPVEPSPDAVEQVRGDALGGYRLLRMADIGRGLSSGHRAQ